MKKTATFLLSCVAAVHLALPGYADLSLTQKRVLSDLDHIHSIFDVKYAPKQWKQEFANWDLHQAIEEAKNKIAISDQLSLKECQKIIRDFFNSTKDYHVGVSFYSTESAALPFLVKGAQGRYFVCHVERGSSLPFGVGDEIVSFGGRPIHEVVEELRLREYGSNCVETDRALAEMSLTYRVGSSAQNVPCSDVEVTGYRKGSNQRFKALLQWSYVPEKIRDFASIIPQTQCKAMLAQPQREALEQDQEIKTFFRKLMLLPLWKPQAALEPQCSHALGARKSFIPDLGTKVWTADSSSFFDAYIFETPSHRRVGYIRIPHYLGGLEEVEEWGERMEFFQQWTDALVIDQVNNPGGSLFYLYALASTLTDRPLEVPKHRITLTQEEVYIAHRLLAQLEEVDDDFSACEVLGDFIEGYSVDRDFALITKKFCHTLINQWEQGKLISDPTYLFGFDTVKPHPNYRYRKPVLLLTNSLDFSAADFFPAIVQDNKLATILGTRTSGAGGYVVSVKFPNHSGISDFILTGSLAERLDSKPIENLGVRPDISYSLTPADLQGNYRGYRTAILETVDALLQK